MGDSLFDQDDLRLFREILDTQSCSGDTAAMETLIMHTAESFGATVEIDERNFYVTKGQASVYPCLVAHTDTVHPLLPAERYAVRDYDGVFSAYDPINGIPAGIGGDDKIGVFIALYFLRHLPAVKAAFFCDEEIGFVQAIRARDSSSSPMPRLPSNAIAAATPTSSERSRGMHYTATISPPRSSQCFRLMGTAKWSAEGPMLAN